MEIHIDSKTDMIKSVTIGGHIILLKKELSIKNYGELTQHLKYLEQTLELANLMPGKAKSTGHSWEATELREFIDKSSELQQAVLETLAETSDKVTAEEMQEKIQHKYKKVPLRALAGVGSAFTRRKRYYGEKENFFESDHDDKIGRWYAIKDKYRKIIQEYFGK